MDTITGDIVSNGCDYVLVLGTSNITMVWYAKKTLNCGSCIQIQITECCSIYERKWSSKPSDLGWSINPIGCTAGASSFLVANSKRDFLAKDDTIAYEYNGLKCLCISIMTPNNDWNLPLGIEHLSQSRTFQKYIFDCVWHKCYRSGKIRFVDNLLCMKWNRSYFSIQFPNFISHLGRRDNYTCCLII